MTIDELKWPRWISRLFPILLILSIYGFALSLLLWRGTYKPSLYLCAFALLGLAATRPTRFQLQRPVILLVALVLTLYLQGHWLLGGRTAGNFHEVLLWFALMTFAITLLPQLPGGPAKINHPMLASILIAGSVPIQIAAYGLKISKAGLFSNIHMLALYSVMTIPVLFYLSGHAKTPARWLFMLAFAGDFWLLMKTQSRPGFLALLAGSLVVIPLLASRTRLIAAGGIILVPTTLYATGIFGFAARINELVVNFAREERVAIWRETLALQQTSSLAEWAFGHGLGQFYWDYQPYSSFHRIDDHPHPHNFILEITYSLGVFGLLLVTAAYGALYVALARQARNAAAPVGRKLAILFICILSTHLIHTFLTLPIFSRPCLYPLSLLLGAAFIFLNSSASAPRRGSP